MSNPSYAGTYVFGRYHSSRIVSPGGVISTKTVQLDLKDWPVVIYEHHQGYISWDDYLANQARLAANTTNAGARPPREGQALCQGIIFCGSCGRPMSTRYHRNGQPAYECSSARADHVSTPTCRSISTTTLDDAVVEQLLAALNPEEFALALAVADEVSDRRVCQSRALELALERAHYEAQRAERAFIACEPENRLVARSLEQRWEARLGALCEAESALATAKKAIPALPSRKDLEALSADLEKLWYQPSTSSRDRKRLLRTLIADVTLLPETDLSKAHIGIRWHSGATDELVVARAEYGRYRRTNPAAVSLAHSLADLSNHDLAEELNAAGYVTGAGRAFDNDSVAWLRYSHHIPQPKVLVDGESSVPEVAHYLGTSSATVIGWIVRGSLRARRGVNNQWCIPFDPKVQDACRALADGSVPTRRCDSSDSEASCELTIAEVADVVQVSAGTVYQWIKVGHLCARKDSKGRLFISFDPDIEVACRARVAGSVHIGCTYKKSGQ